MREKLIELLDEVHRKPLGKEYRERLGTIADHLIANGVTITPAVPGARIGHDMTEVCYRNGEEAMREKVINYLRDQKGVTMGVIRSTIGDIIEKVRKL